MRSPLQVTRLLLASVLMLASFSLFTFGQTTVLTFDELPTQPVNGLTFKGVTFGFTVGGVASTDAFYNSANGGQLTYVQDPSLEGNSAGVLTLTFATPTSALRFGIARSTTTTLKPGFTVELFDANGVSIQVTPVNTDPLILFSEGQFSYSGTPVKRAVITFNDPTALRFALDNLVIGAELAVGPGLPLPPASAVSDQKLGSVLFFNTYTSAGAFPALENTRINITNVNPNLATFVHLYLVDGASCSAADTFICLTANQTASFTAAEVDPGVRGYVVAVAVSGETGCPISFNFLTGDEYVKYGTGNQANLGAEAFANSAPTGANVEFCNANSDRANLVFDGLSYNRVPLVLASSSIPSIVDDNFTRVILNRVGGSLVTGASGIGNVFILVFDDAEHINSTVITTPFCHVEVIPGLNGLPRIIGGWTNFIPAGSTGWLKLWSSSGFGLIGAEINFNPFTDVSGNKFNGGHNLHKLTLAPFVVVEVPVFPPSC
jgi:hypothetical protein